MLRSVRELEGYAIEAEDGQIGTVSDFYFDDSHYSVRYVVVNLSRRLPERRVLVSPEAAGRPDWQKASIPVLLNESQVKNSPDIDVKIPIAREQEEELAAYFGWPMYWKWGPRELVPPGDAVEASLSQGAEMSLRSVKHVTGYHIEARDGEIGHLEDFIVDDEKWLLRCAVIATRNWFPGKRVLVSVGQILSFNWSELTVHLALNRADVERSPAFDPAEPVNRQYEEQFYDYYGRRKYW